MKPTRTLIDGLRETARRIESGEYYYLWALQSHCNCGLLVKTVLPEQEFSLPNTWSSSKYYCKESALPVRQLFAELEKIGLETYEDFRAIEYLKHPLAYDLQDFFDSARNVIIFFRRLANSLEAELIQGDGHLESADLLELTVPTKTMETV